MRLFGRGRPDSFERSGREGFFSGSNPGTLNGGRVVLGLLAMFATFVTIISCTSSDPTITPTSVPDVTVTTVPSPTATAPVTPTTEPSPSPTTAPIEPTSTPTVPQSPTPDAPATLAPTETPTAAPPTLTLTPTSTPVPQPAELFLEVLSPANQSTVDEDVLKVTGRSTPDATASVNGQLAVMDISGSFEATLRLTEGPNLIEVIASDLTGEVRDQVLVVVYLP